MEYPKQLLMDIYWSFAEGPFADQSSFETALKQYYKAISGKTLGQNMDEVVFAHPTIVIQYTVWNEEEDDHDEPQIQLQADQAQGFKFGELLYKIQAAIGERLAEEDAHFFEGLEFATDEDPDYIGTPVYFLLQGS